MTNRVEDMDLVELLLALRQLRNKKNLADSLSLVCYRRQKERKLCSEKKKGLVLV